MKRLRLVKVLVQPVFVLDDGDTVEEIEHPAIAIPASEWPTYSGERFPREVGEWEAVLNAEEVSPPNRAQRRARRAM
jgi:hypothetical protein